MFKNRKKLMQEAYDLGLEHGIEIGHKEQLNKTLELLVHNIETINWIKEDPLEVRDIIPLVKGSKEEFVNVWE